MANDWPDCLTCAQSITPCHWDVSMPFTVEAPGQTQSAPLRLSPPSSPAPWGAIQAPRARAITAVRPRDAMSRFMAAPVSCGEEKYAEVRALAVTARAEVLAERAAPRWRARFSAGAAASTD